MALQKILFNKFVASLVDNFGEVVHRNFLCRINGRLLLKSNQTVYAIERFAAQTLSPRSNIFI